MTVNLLLRLDFTSLFPSVRRPVCTASLPRVLAIAAGPEFTVAEAEAQALIWQGRFDEARTPGLSIGF